MYITVPAELADREREKYEKAKARRERYEQRTGRKRHDLNESRIGGHKYGPMPYREYPFVMWDGEAPQDTGYSLFGSSAGHEICHPHLTTEECFDLILQAKLEMPHSIFFWYGGRYDWDEITRQSIPLVRLSRLKQTGVVRWHGYRLSECEGKIYTVSKDGVSATIYDVSGWFHCPYIDALSKYDIGSPALRARIQSGKDSRSEFLWSEIGEIREYMRLELKLGPPLMECIRSLVLAAGFDPKGWYGPSALARQCFTRYHVFDAMATCPVEVNDAACFAFAGGRFENFRGGILGESTTVDQNSAYMHAALDLPDLAHGRWRQGRRFEPGKFGLYHIRYHDKSRPFDISKPHPLFRRLPNGTVCWPDRVEGWYWSPEAELVADNPAAEFIESWIFDEETSARPFAFVLELFLYRLDLQAADNAAEKAIKWALAAIYGQLARAVGWDQKQGTPPKTHQIEWAGYITSKCRAEMFKVARWAGERLITIDTDSVTFLGSIRDGDGCPVLCGNSLGQWKSENSSHSVVFQNGVYFTHDGVEWSKGKTRGMERRRGTPAVTPEILAKAILTNSIVKLVPRKRYITTKMALNGQLASHGDWREHKGNELDFGGGGKRYHNRRFCETRCQSKTKHVFMPRPVFGTKDNLFDTWSVPHYLPWKTKEPHEKIDRGYLQDILWIDTERVDNQDDEWKATLIKRAASSHVHQ